MDMADVFATMATRPRTFPLRQLTDVEEKLVDVPRLASEYHLIVITLKSTRCPVCPQLLKILNVYGLDAMTNTYVDPFTQKVWQIDKNRKRFMRLLLKKDTYFIVLCPGPSDEVRQLKNSVPFIEYPFVAGDQAMAIGSQLKLVMSETELWPAILSVQKGTLAAEVVSIGRRPGSYNQQPFLKRVILERCRMEMRGINISEETHLLIDQLKRRIAKCSNNTLVVSSSSSLPMATNAPTDSFHQLPAEVLERILSCLPDTKSLIRVSGVSRKLYITSCQVMILRLRQSLQTLRGALPQSDEYVLADAEEAVNDSLDRWQEDTEGIGIRELERRVEQLERQVTSASKWTRRWSVRRPREFASRYTLQASRT